MSDVGLIFLYFFLSGSGLALCGLAWFLTTRPGVRFERWILRRAFGGGR